MTEQRIGFLNKFEIAQVLYLRPEKVDVAIALIPRWVCSVSDVTESSRELSAHVIYHSSGRADPTAWSGTAKAKRRNGCRRSWMRSGMWRGSARAGEPEPGPGPVLEAG